SGAEVSRIVLRSSVTKQFRSGRLVPANGCCDRRLRATTCVPRYAPYAPASSRWMKEAGAPKKAPPWRGLVFTVQWMWDRRPPVPNCRRGCRIWDGEKEKPRSKAMAGAKLGAFSNSQTVRFRYCGISANWGRQTLHRLRKKKAPPKRGRAQGRLACSRKGVFSSAGGQFGA